MRKFTAIILTFVVLFFLATPSQAATNSNSVVSPMYAEASSVGIDLTITISGFALVNVKVSGKDTLKNISVITHLERNVYGMWVRVEIGQPNNDWTYSCNSNTLNKSFTTNLTVQGQYRAVSIITLTGDTVEEIIVKDLATY